MYLYGAGGHAKVIIDILEALGEPIDGLIDDNSELNGLLGYPVFLRKEDPFPLIISIGDNWTRKNISERLKGKYGQAVHPSAIVSHFASADEGTVVMQGAIIQACAAIGRHCIVNTGASVGHDCRIADFVHISPHSTLCGNVHIGEGTWIGAGTTVIPGVKIGRWSIIGAGSVVTKDIPDHVVAFGNSCKVRKKLFYTDKPL